MTSGRWILPSLHSAHKGCHERKVTWQELFYDLVYVAAIIQLGNRLSDDVSWSGVICFVALFIPIWWPWTGVTFYVNRFAIDDLVHRLLIFTQIGFVTILAMSTVDAFGALGQQFILAYVEIRAILIVLYLRAYRHVPAARLLTRRFIVGFTLAASIWLISAFVPPPARYALWVVAMIADLAVPFISRRFNSLLPPDVPHMTERYGLFTIIVAGEAFVKVISGAPSTPLAVDQLLLGARRLVVAGSLWWLYFDDVAGSPLKARAHAPFVWLYGHLPLAIGLTAFGVAIKKVIFIHGGEALPEKYRLLLGGALVTYLIFVMMIDLVTIRSRKGASLRTRAGWRLGVAGIIALVAIFGAGLLPALFMAALAAACVAPVVVDLIAKPPSLEPPHGQHAAG